jgi:multidrug efflux pump subunit AcrA (membrane-fusion protein)
VFVADGEVARRVPVEVGSSIGQRIVILNGLKAGDHVVVKGQQLLGDGVRISEGVL